MTALQKKEQEFVALGNDCCKTQCCKRNCLEKNGEKCMVRVQEKTVEENQVSVSD